MDTIASQITSLTIVYATVYSGADQRKHQLRVSGLFVFTGTGEFPAQMASNAENASIWWRHHDFYQTGCSWLANAEASVTPNATIIYIHCLVSNMIYRKNVPIPQRNWCPYWTIICQYSGKGHTLFAN